MAASRQHHRALPAPGRTSHRGRALPGRVGRAALAFLATASLATGSASAEEVFTSQAAAANATDSTWIPAPTRRAAVCIVDTGTDTTLDTTNVVNRPAVTAITPVSLDHQAFLGPTIAAIAGEKAGILKPGAPAVIGPQTDEGEAPHCEPPVRSIGIRHIPAASIRHSA